MFTPIIIQYLKDPSRYGGRQEIDSQVSIDVVWDESIKNSTNPRMLNLNAEVKVQTVLDDILDDDKLEPGKVWIVNGSKTYELLDRIAVPTDLGLDGTYELILRERKAR